MAFNIDPKDLNLQDAAGMQLVEVIRNLAKESGAGSGLSDEAKQALMDSFENVAWANYDGQDYYNALYDTLFGTTPVTPTLVSISAVFTQGSAVIYDTDSLNTLKQYLVVTATYSDSSTATVNDYTLSGTLTAGTSTITASYQGQSDTFTVNVTARAALESISAVFTQGSAIIYDTDSLNTLKQYLVVTATYTDSTTTVVTDYTLSGTLEAGTSTITVSYEGETDTFSVTVTHYPLPIAYQLVEWVGNTGKSWIWPTGHMLPSAFRIESKTKLDGYNSGASYGNIVAVFQPNTTTYGMELAYKKEDNTVIMFLGAQSVLTPSDIDGILTLGAVCTGTTVKAYEVVSGERVYGTEQSVSRDYTHTDYGIFYAGTSSTSYNQLVGRIYYIELYDSNDVLIAQYLRLSSNTFKHGNSPKYRIQRLNFFQKMFS